MIKRFLRVVALALIVTCSGCGGGEESADARTQKLRDYMNSFRTEHGIPGIILQVSMPNEGFVFKEGSGLAHIDTGEPADPSLQWRIGSNSKVFTATLVLQLADEGKILLDDPVAKYIADVPNGGSITVRMLLNHTSGLYNYSDDQEIWENPDRTWRRDELLAIAYRHPPLFQPGVRYSYSNTNYVLLGLLVEKSTGRTFEEGLQSRFIEPLGLQKTFMAHDGEFSSPYIHGYHFEDGTIDVTHFNPSWAWAAGGMVSTSEEMTSWIRAVVTGEFLSDMMQQERFAHLREVAKLDGSPVRYGLGIFEFKGYRGHNGEVPGYNSGAYYNPDSDSSIVFVLTTTEGFDFKFLIGVLDILSGSGTENGPLPTEQRTPRFFSDLSPNRR